MGIVQPQMPTLDATSGACDIAAMAIRIQMLASPSHFSLTSILAWSLALGIECPFDMRFQGSDNSHARKQHGSAIFGGIDQHLDG